MARTRQSPAMTSVAPPIADHPGNVRDTLRFLTCGSVDDGKSTLLGRLLSDADLLTDDQRQRLAASGAGDDGTDYAAVLDGLIAEREQKITIDVGWRYFSTQERAFVVADAPGHEQYTANMASGASNAELALLLVDARKGILTQTRRHARIAALFGIRAAVLAVNKMDLVGWSRDRFEEIAAAFAILAAELGITQLVAVPLCARSGDNVVRRSTAMGWYAGPTLIEHLESVAIERDPAHRPLRLPVQWVNRPGPDFRGYCGSIASGALSPGLQVRVVPGGQEARIRRIVTPAGDASMAIAGQAVTVTLDRELDISRGDVIAGAGDAPDAADHFAAHLLWTGGTEELLPGRSYRMLLGSCEVPAVITALKYRVDVNTGGQEACHTLRLNDIGVCDIALDRPVPFESYRHNRDLGGFILVDRQTAATVGAGTIDFALRRSGNRFWQHLDVDRDSRARALGQRPRVVWFTGLSGSGKSTIANLVEKKLHAAGRHTYLIDGDNLRHGLNRDLGFTDADRVENIRRSAEVARLMADAGLIVLVGLISPFRAEREMARSLLPEGDFIEVFVDTPLAICERRDPKGLYAKARAGNLRNFTGIDSPYEPPPAPDLRLDGTHASPEHLADQVIALLD
ncbi:MAG: adenylyl-sulfate kinase [Azospirillaceae bacterium]